METISRAKIHSRILYCVSPTKFIAWRVDIISHHAPTTTTTTTTKSIYQIFGKHLPCSRHWQLISEIRKTLSNLLANNCLQIYQKTTYNKVASSTQKLKLPLWSKLLPVFISVFWLKTWWAVVSFPSGLYFRVSWLLRPPPLPRVSDVDLSISCRTHREPYLWHIFSHVFCSLGTLKPVAPLAFMEMRRQMLWFNSWCNSLFSCTAIDSITFAFGEPRIIADLPWEVVLCNKCFSFVLNKIFCSGANQN